MPPRLPCPAPRSVGSLLRSKIPSRPRVCIVPITTPRQYATINLAALGLKLPDDYVPPTQPPSARPANQRKTQLLRTYTSLLRSSPLMLIFQHNNLTAHEWAAVRRELRFGLQNAVSAPAQESSATPENDLSSKIGIQVVRTNILDVAVRITELERLSALQQEPQVLTDAAGKKVYNHDLSKKTWGRVNKAMEEDQLQQSNYPELSALLTGPIAVVAFPAISPAHLAAVLKVLAPSPPAYPAPTRRKSPGYYDPVAQSGFHKLMLVGGRVEGKAFDSDGLKWVGSIEGGLDGLRAQLVYMLQSAGMGLTDALDGASKSLWFTLENRKAMLEEEQKGPTEGEAEGEAKGEAKE